MSIDTYVKSVSSISRTLYSDTQLNPQLDHMVQASQQTIDIMGELNNSLKCDQLYRQIHSSSRQTNRQIDSQLDRQFGTQIIGEKHNYINKQLDRQVVRQSDSQVTDSQVTDSQVTDSQVDRQLGNRQLGNRQLGRQILRQVDVHKVRETESIKMRTKIHYINKLQIFRLYNSALVAACDQGLFGLVIMMISAALCALVFTVLVWCNSHTWIYFKHKGKYVKVNNLLIDLF